MRTIIVTGSPGLIGSEAAKRFAKDGGHVVGIDNDIARTILWSGSLDAEDA